MRKLILFILLFPLALQAQIIADHTVVDKYDDIPQQWIDSVKKMWLSYPGESHALGVLKGLELLEDANSTYAVSTRDYSIGGTPEAYSTAHLRASTAMWGDAGHSTGWIYELGEEDWWTNSTAINRVKASLYYCNTSGPALSAIGFGWCWDATSNSSGINPTTGTDPVTGNHWWGKSIGSPSGSLPWGINDDDNAITGNSVNLDDYISATQEFIDYCTSNSIPTKVFFTTGPVDPWLSGSVELISDEALYQGHLKYEHIRNYVKAHPSAILFDYGDILCYDNDGTLTTKTWNGNTFPSITALNLYQGQYAHISYAGTVRLAKAMWWMLARIAGWDGGEDIGGDYYVSTNGDDNNDGSFNSPFASMQKAVNVAVAGDTVYIRGGLYNLITGIDIDPTDSKGSSGTAGNPICYFAYPGETPIFDLSGVNQTGPGTFYNIGLNINRAQYLHFKGLTIRNVWQGEYDNFYVSAQGISTSDAANLTFENVTVHDVSGRAFGHSSGAWNSWDDETEAPFSVDSTRWINCDAYNLCDTINYFVEGVDTTWSPGNSADGWKTHAYQRGYLSWEGCRAWNYSDDGYDPSGECYKIFNNSWAMSSHKYYSICHNADSDMEGNGFKISSPRMIYQGDTIFYPELLTDTILVKITNCIATHCVNVGFYNNLFMGLFGVDTFVNNNARIYNNISYFNGSGFVEGGSGYTPRLVRTSTYRNNVSIYSTITGYGFDPIYEIGIYRPSIYNESHNNWDATQQLDGWPGWEYTDTVTVTNADFQSIDSTQIYGSRKADGSLPDITFLHLAPGSDLIGAGTYVGMSATPDMGVDWAYLDAGEPPSFTPVVANIPNQTITTGSSFATINLDNYVSDADNTDSQITWTYSGDTHINISIVNRVATITYDNGFTGSETITFTATDPDDLSDSDQAVFVVNAASTPSGTCLLRINYAGSKKIRQGSERRIGIN